MDVIFSKCVDINALQIRYTLGETLGPKRRYQIEITCGNESTILKDVSDSFQEAKDLFDMLVHGTVTPVTAEDVFEDWKYLNR